MPERGKNTRRLDQRRGYNTFQKMGHQQYRELPLHQPAVADVKSSLLLTRRTSGVFKKDIAPSNTYKP